MINKENFPKAYVEVEEIINNLQEEEYNKIDKSFINMIKEKKDKNYIFKLDYSKDIEKQKILKETRLLLGYIFLHYLADDDESKMIKQKFKEDIIQDEIKKEQTYSNNVF